MSLDVYLETPIDPEIFIAADFLHDHGFYLAEKALREMGSDRLYSSNITHNLGNMAEEAGIYKHLWRPEEIGITNAGQLIEPLKVGLDRLKNDKAHYEQFDAPNGWGRYIHFIPWLEKYLKACVENPTATVSVSR